MNEKEQTGKCEPTPIKSVGLDEQREQVESVGSAIVAVTEHEEIPLPLAIEDQAPRSWDLHRSGW